MTYNKSFLLACCLALMISLNSCVFLKSNGPVEKAILNADCPAIVKETIEAMQPLKAGLKQTPTTTTKETVAPAPEVTQAPGGAQGEEGADAEQETTAPADQGTEQPAAAPATPAAECPTGAQGDYKNSLKDLQAKLEEQINILNNQQQEAQRNVNQMEAKETQNLINTVNQKEKEVLGTGATCPTPAPQPTPEATPAAQPAPPKAEAPVLTKPTTPPPQPEKPENGCDVKQANLIQVDGVDAIDKFASVLDLKNVSAPTIANSISTTTSIAKGTADDNSISNTVQNVKSTTTAEAEGQQNAIAVANVVGNTEAKTANLAVDNAKAVTVVDNVNNGTAKANSTENSLASANVKNDQKSETNTVAGNNSTAVGGTQMTSNTESTANAAQGSIADTKAISDEKSTTNTGAAANSTAIGITAVNTDTASLADASNKSLAQSVAESQNTAKTTTVALDNSAAVGVTKLDSNSNSTALSANGGNALSTSDAKSCVATESVANNNSASIVQNNGGSQSNATSVSNGIAAPYENPLQNATNDNTTGVNLQQGGGNESAPCSVKIPSILEAATKVTLKSEDGSSNLRDKVMSEKESCGNLEDHKADVLQAAKESSLATGATENCDTERTKEKEDRDKMKAEERSLREQNKRLKQERKDQEDRDRAARKASERRQRKSRKYRSGSRGRSDRSMDSDACDMTAPRVQSRSGSGRMYDEDCELNRKVSKDFDESLAEESKPDERFDEKNMFRDNIKEYDERCNDERVNDDCTDICKKENLGGFVSSEIQDILRGNFLFKCNCKEGTTDWYMYDSKTDKSHALSSTSRHLLDDREPINFCDDMPLPRTEPIEAGNTTAAPVLQGGAAPVGPRQILSAPSQDMCEADDEGEDTDDDSRCGNFVSERIDAAKRRAKGGSDDKMHSDLGECFNNFISDKFNKLHRRLNKIKSKHTNYVKDLHKKQLRKQASKVEDIVDKSAENVNGPELSGASSCEPLKGGDHLRNIQANMNDLKRDLKLNTEARKATPEDVYFQARNTKDEDRFNQRLQSRFDDKIKCDDDRFTNRFGNNNRYTARDGGAVSGAKKAASLKSDSGAFISAEVGRIKEQNKNYLGKIKNMFGGCE